MTQYVATTIKTTTRVDDTGQLIAWAAHLNDAADQARQAASIWMGVKQDVAHSRASSSCMYVRQGAPSVTPPDHVALSYDALQGEFDTLIDEFTLLANRLSATADRLIRAYSLYSDTEVTAQRIINELLAAGIELYPIPSLYVGAATVAVSPLIGAAGNQELMTPVRALGQYFTYFQDGVVSGLSSFIIGSAVGAAARKMFTGLSKLDFPNLKSLKALGDPKKWQALEWSDIIKGVFTTGEAGELHRALNVGYTGMGRIIQGEDIDVYPVTPPVNLAKPTTIAQAYANAEALDAQRSSDDGYATVCIQQLKRPDGSRGWIITIPDSDNHLNSPCSGNQTLEMLSSSSRHRLDSDEVRFIRDAMSQAGVKNGDEIVLIGAAQGGLAAASLASGLSGTYEFTHVVTAAAPIANHDIPGSTYVTSVEMESDYMTALDGAHNPVRESWLTVEGAVVEDPVKAATPVTGSGDTLENPHDMEYQRAAWTNASQSGSPAVEKHETHFQEAVAGDVVATTYYQGRLSH